MSKATFIISTPRLLDQVVQLIDGVDMEDRDTKGDLYEYMLGQLRSRHTEVAAGVFGAEMRVSLINDGPVTFLLEG